jgi:quercetin dioxygenase-like cupin family protein
MTAPPKTASEIPAATIINPLELTSYRAGEVASRTLLNRPGGSITLFAFDAGEGLSEHTAPFDAVIYVLDGAAEITIAGASVAASAGEMVLLPARQPHALSARTRFKMLLTILRSA